MPGIEFQPYFSGPIDPLVDPKYNWTERTAIIRDSEGKVTQTVEGVVFPETWIEQAVNITVSKYFKLNGSANGNSEKDVRQLVRRVTAKIGDWGIDQSYFSNPELFQRELAAVVLNQSLSFNSPVWFNLGLDSYGLEHDAPGTYYMGPEGKPIEVTNVYEHPQISACFICSPKDSIEDMIFVGGVVSAKVFKGGSGIGGNWSDVRSAGESISGGGTASGAKRFMDVQDAVARVIKSGGQTRRAATMQIISAWHPDMRYILREKCNEEEKARILIQNGAPNNWESHTFQNLRGQNVNYSVRIGDDFWRAYEDNSIYQIKEVLTGRVVEEIPARALLEQIAFFAYKCGDPGIQNDDVINRWNTCPNSFKINASNPCSEYMFADSSSCNLASLNLLSFMKDGRFDIQGFKRAVDLSITAQDIMVSEASYPTEAITLNSHRFRPLGLGYANLGALIMSQGIPYDSDEARNLAAAITANMTAEAYLQSTRLAEQIGPFEEYEKNKEPLLKVLEMHRAAAKKLPASNGLEGLVNEAVKTWDIAIERASRFGVRNAQVTVLAPTGTIGFMMGCDTTGCEPYVALKVYKELAGGGSMEIVPQQVGAALKALNYPDQDAEKIIQYLDENHTAEGCSYLKPEHLPVFDCANAAGKGTRFLSGMSHLKMLAALQPHISGAISKTINRPNSASVDEIMGLFEMSAKLGVKAVAIYRDGSKAAAPLSIKRSVDAKVYKRGEREHLPSQRAGYIQKFKLNGVSMFITAGFYPDGRLGELFYSSLERGSQIDLLSNMNAVQFSEKLQWGVPLEDAIEVWQKAGEEQLTGITDHPFITHVRGPNDFIFKWLQAHFLGQIPFVSKSPAPERRPLPGELLVYQQVPKLHMFPSVAGYKYFDGVPTLEETIERVSGTNYWQDEGLDTRRTLERIEITRSWGRDQSLQLVRGVLTGQVCESCGAMLISDGKCTKCPRCQAGGGCGG